MSLSINTNIDSLIVQRNLNTSQGMLTTVDGTPVLGSADQLGRRRRRRLRRQPAPAGPGQRRQPGGAEHPGSGRARADRAGRAQRRGADAPADARARGAAGQRHQLEIRRRSDRKRVETARKRARPGSAKRRSSTASNSWPRRKKSSSRWAPTKKKRSKSKPPNSRKTPKASKSKKSKRLKQRSKKSPHWPANSVRCRIASSTPRANQAIYGENLSAAQSSLVDANMAAEMSNFTKAQVLQQADVAILAQANSLPQAVLKLVEGRLSTGFLRP